MSGIDDEVSGWLSGDDPLVPTPERVAELEETMPWFLLPAVLLLRRRGGMIDDNLRRRLLARLAVAAPDLQAMEMAADSDLSAELSGFYPESEPAPKPSTTSAIDKFISTYGSPDPGEEELLTRLIFNPAPDYAQILSREEERSLPKDGDAPAGSQDARINTFIIKSKASDGRFPSVEPEPEPAAAPAVSPVARPEPADDVLPSESLAQIYIRRGNYARAFEIITQLNLNFPEKSIYFADQLRFLGKLMRLTGASGPSGEQ
ncbi:MAG: hypothetical protein K2G81_05045, partial [Muribaculaceae bacterium]|nr:hypothetical protein [Muribaculaceae bacterium]